MPERADQIVAEVREAIEVVVGQILLGELPDTLVRIEVGRIRREGLEMQSGVAPAQISDRLSGMNAPVVPHHDDVAPQMSKQVPQELTDFLLLDVLGVQVKVEPQAATTRTDRHGRDGRDPIVAIAMPEDRRLAARSPGAAYGRDQEEARFVGKDEVGTQPPGVFFTRGHSCLFQRAIFCSSRSRARRSGFWWLQPS